MSQDLLQLYTKAGAKGTPVVLLLTDNQLTKEVGARVGGRQLQLHGGVYSAHSSLPLLVHGSYPGFRKCRPSLSTSTTCWPMVTCLTSAHQRTATTLSMRCVIQLEAWHHAGFCEVEFHTLT